MEWYPKIEGKRCDKGYRHVKKTKRCVRQKEKEKEKEKRYPVYVNITFPDGKIYPELDSSVIHLPWDDKTYVLKTLYDIIKDLFEYRLYDDPHTLELYVVKKTNGKIEKNDILNNKLQTLLYSGKIEKVNDIPPTIIDKLVKNSRLFIKAFPIKKTMVEPDSYIRTGKRCRKNYTYRKKDNRCVSRKVAAPSPVPPAPSPVPAPPAPPAPSPVPIPAPPPSPIQPKIQIPRYGSKCKKLFKYNKTTKFCERCPDGTTQIGKNCVLQPTHDSQSKKEDHVVVLPEPDPDPAPGMSLKDMIDALEKGGEEIKNPKYAAGRHMVFVYIYLIKKYASPCLLFNKNSGKHASVINYDVQRNNLDYPDNIGESMLDCIRRGTDTIFITLYMYYKRQAHVNILIYRPFKRIVERYEPHGQETGWGSTGYDEYKFNFKLKQLFEERVSNVLGEYTPVYKTPYELCPMHPNGFQAIENLLPYDRKKENGYCQMWSMFLMETILLNPTLNTEDIIDECIQVGKNDPKYFINVIRGYTQQMAKELKLYLGQHVKDVKQLGTPRTNEAFNQIDLNTLINETLATTSKIVKPMKQIDAAPETFPVVELQYNEKQIDTLSIEDAYRYIKFIKDQHIYKILVPVFKKDKYKKELNHLMMSRKLRWATLMDNMFNYFFTTIPPLLLKRYKYFVRFDSNPPEQLNCDHVPLDSIELMNETKAKYLNFHTFFTIVQSNYTQKPQVLLAKDVKKITIDVKSLSKKDVVELLCLIKFHKLDVKCDADKEELENLCKKRNLTIQNLQNLRSLF